MPRTHSKVAAHRRRKRVLRQARGAWGARSKVYTVAQHHVDKAMLYAYRDRRTKKRVFRQLWITRISAAARLNGTTYSRLIAGLNKKAVDIDRKILADLAVSNPEAFAEVVRVALA